MHTHLNYGDSRLPETFWSRCIPEPNSGCWLWTGMVHGSGGYGSMSLGYRKRCRAHRFSYEALVGPIPTGLVIDHLCRNVICVNPMHLEAVTIRVNTLRGIGPFAVKAAKTHCVRGHEFNETNTLVRPKGRECIACSRIRAGISNAARSERNKQKRAS